MADQTDDELLLEDKIEGDEPEIEAESGSEAEVQPEGEDDEEIVIAFDGEAAPASEERDTDLVKKLRKEIRERDRKLAEYQKSSAPQRIEVGPKPTLAACDYDEDRFEAELDQWKAREAEAKAQETAVEEQSRKVSEEWQADVQRYRTAQAGLGFKDVQQAEQTVSDVLSETQRAVIVRVADNAAQLEYALAKSPGKLTEISKITDPLKLAAAVAKLEGKLTVTKQRKAPPPETIPAGRGTAVGAVDKQLERLEAEAARTGDRTKVVNYKREQRLKAGN